MYMDAFRTQDTPEKECLSLLFIAFIFVTGIAVCVIEKIRGNEADK